MRLFLKFIDFSLIWTLFFPQTSRKVAKSSQRSPVPHTPTSHPTPKAPHTTMRYHLLDALRGFALVNMIAYHTLWDVVQTVPQTIPQTSAGALTPALLFTPAIHTWQQAIGFTFIFLAGFCFPLGRRPLFRGVELIALGEVISLVTFLAIPDEPVRFGVLTLIGFGMLVLALVHAWTRTLHPAWMALLGVLSLAVFVVFHDVQSGGAPSWLYANSFTALLGFPPAGFVSSDYYPLVPHVFVMLAGLCAYRCSSSFLPIFSHHAPTPLGRGLEWMGRHSLAIYLGHQVIIYAVVMGVAQLLA
ncbi:hypothetical protein B9T39_05045 [Alloscardovia macacae]|uniref:Heparan-alpha-glucosaminide N-acetyltransferase catalytic domain-containing protein n=2 Tax=Alloscardovia macacae TaxID=1160091 RepID=A0A1Y2T1D9_9BIFI|nr:hypothetical protein B9T39_05045 [Alloscardovia macacae]